MQIRPTVCDGSSAVPYPKVTHAAQLCRPTAPRVPDNEGHLHCLPGNDPPNQWPSTRQALILSETHTSPIRYPLSTKVTGPYVSDSSQPYRRSNLDRHEHAPYAPNAGVRIDRVPRHAISCHQARRLDATQGSPEVTYYKTAPWPPPNDCRPCQATCIRLPSSCLRPK